MKNERFRTVWGGTQSSDDSKAAAEDDNQPDPAYQAPELREYITKEGTSISALDKENKEVTNDAGVALFKKSEASQTTLSAKAVVAFKIPTKDLIDDHEVWHGTVFYTGSPLCKYFSFHNSDDGIIYNDAHKKIGTYDIRGNGYIITLHFDKDDSAYGTEIDGNITLWGNLETDKFKGSQERWVKFNDNVTIPFEFEDTRPLTISKKCTSKKMEPVNSGIPVAYWFKCHYEVKITVPNGMDQDQTIVLNDRVTHWLTEQDHDSNHYESPRLELFDAEGHSKGMQSFSTPAFGGEGARDGIKMIPAKPSESLEKGAYYIFSYDAVEWVPASDYDKLTYNQRYYEENQAEAYPQGEENKKVTTTCQVDYSLPKDNSIDLQKTGSGTYDPEEHSITWNFTLTLTFKTRPPAGEVKLDDYFDPQGHNVNGMRTKVKSIKLVDSAGNTKWECPASEIDDGYIKTGIYSGPGSGNNISIFGSLSSLPCTIFPPGGPRTGRIISASSGDRYIVTYEIVESSHYLNSDETLKLHNYAKANLNGNDVKAECTPEAKNETTFPTPHKFGDYTDKDRTALRWTVRFNDDKTEQKSLDHCVISDSMKNSAQKSSPTDKCSVIAYPQGVLSASKEDQIKLGVKTYENVAMPLTFVSKGGKSGFTDASGKWYEIPSYLGMFVLAYDQPMKYSDTKTTFKNTIKITSLIDGKYKTATAEKKYVQPDKTALSKTVDRTRSTKADVNDKGQLVNHWTITLNNLKKSQRYYDLEDDFSTYNYGKVEMKNSTFDDDYWMTPEQVKGIKISAYDTDGKLVNIPIGYGSGSGRQECLIWGHYRSGIWTGDYSGFTSTSAGSYSGNDSIFPAENYIASGLSFHFNNLDTDLSRVVITYDTTTSVKYMNPDSKRVMYNTARITRSGSEYSGPQATAKTTYYVPPESGDVQLNKYNITDDGSRESGLLKKKFSKDGLLYYCAVLNANRNAQGDLHFTDTLPAGTQLVTDQKWSAGDGKITYNPASVNICRNGIAANYLGMARANGWGSSGESALYNGRGLFSDDQTKVNYDQSSNKLTVDIPQFAFHFDDDHEQVGVVLYYAVKITDPDSFMDGKTSKTLKNDAVLKDDKSEAHSSAETEIDTAKLEKSDGAYNADTGMLTYSLKINPQGVKLSDSGKTITVNDVLTWPAWSSGPVPVKSIEADADAIHLYKLVDGKKVEVAASDYTLNKTTDPDKRQTKITLQVPDGQAYILDYGYKVNMTNHDPTTFTVTNKAALEGMDDAASSDEKTAQVYSTGSSANASTKYTALTLNKTDESTGKSLAGAEFVLEQYTGRAGKEWKVIPGSGENGRYVTDSNGSVQLGDKHSVDGKDITSVRYNYLYRLKEVKAPSGYQIGNNDYQYIYLRNDAITNTCKPDSFNPEKAEQMEVINGVVTVKDPQTPPTPTPVYHHVTVQKVWKLDDGGTRPDSVQVQLMKNGTAYGQPVTLNDANNWTFSWDKLEDDNSTWTVQEVIVPNGFTMTQQVTAETDGSKVTITNDDNPVKPNTPDNPKPNKPNKPNKTVTPKTPKKTVTPKKPSVPRTTVQNTPSSAPQTSDQTRLGTELILFGGAAALLALVLAVKRRKTE
ncbi:MAG: Cna B-type domain-containing protein [Eubacterium sp.]|nr:Cna B-type domain-containing protein [Eubacterium sp.]MCI2197447.1 Cna B-type domain-containing protein [Eubacterium sp.]